MSRHDALFGDDADRTLAVMMATHPRLGQNVLPQLRDQTPGDLVAMIARLALTPIVERPIRLLVQPDPGLVGACRPDDDFVSSFSEAAARTAPPTPFLCTVIDRGVPVFRAPLRQQVDCMAELQYFSRRRDNNDDNNNNGRVSFCIWLPKRRINSISQQQQQPPPCASIMEHQFLDHRHRHATEAEQEAAGCFVDWTDLETPADLLTFRARNTLGIELLVSVAATDPHTGRLTPILPPSSSSS